MSGSAFAVVVACQSVAAAVRRAVHRRRKIVAVRVPAPRSGRDAEQLAAGWGTRRTVTAAAGAQR